jgi:hypothetical protein
MSQVNFTNEFVTVPGTVQPQAPVLPVNSARKFLQVINNGTSGNVRIKFDQNFVVPANEVQVIAFSATPTGGTWTVTDGAGNVTAALAYNESAANLQTALQGLGGIGSGNVTVTGSMANGFVLTYGGSLADTNVPALTVQSSLTSNVGQQSAVQNINWSAQPTAGTFKLQDSAGNQTTALAYNADGTTIQNALNALPAINGGVSNVTVTATTIAITYGNSPLANAPVPPIVVAANTLTNNGTLTNCVQTLFMEPAPQQGNFALMFGGQTTTPLAFNASAAQIQAAFQALSTVGAGNCAVSGFDFQNGFAFAFEGALAQSAQPLIQVLDGPPSQYGTVNGTGNLHADTNPTHDIQKHVPQEIDIQVVMTVPGVGPAAVTSTVTTAQPGIAPLAITASFSVSTQGQAQVVDGVTIPAGLDKVYDYAVPIGAMYIISSVAGSSVQINEG